MTGSAAIRNPEITKKSMRLDSGFTRNDARPGMTQAGHFVTVSLMVPLVARPC